MSTASLVVMAAGLGSRFGGLKQIAPVGPNGEIILAYSVHDAIRSGADKVLFIIRKETEALFRERIGRVIEGRVETHYVHQELDRLPAPFTCPPDREKPWGTGHAILCCKDVVREPFVVINADDFYGRPSYEALFAHLRAQGARPGVPEYAMAGFVLGNTLSPHGHVARGVCRVSAKGCLEEIVERARIERAGNCARYAEGETWRELPLDTTVSMNMWGFTPALFAELEPRFIRFMEGNRMNPRAEFFIPSVVGDLVREGKARVKVLPTPSPWFGVTYKEDLAGVQQAIADMVKRGEYPSPLWG